MPGARPSRSISTATTSLPYLTGQQDRGARKEFIYFNDDGDLVALRYENWKFVFEEQRAPGTLRIWAEPFTKLRLPKLFDLRSDPYERADITSNTYYDWLLSEGYVIRRGPGGGRPVPGVLQGLSAQSAAAELQHRSDRREDAAESGGDAIAVRADAIVDGAYGSSSTDQYRGVARTFPAFE